MLRPARMRLQLPLAFKRRNNIARALHKQQPAVRIQQNNPHFSLLPLPVMNVVASGTSESEINTYQNPRRRGPTT